MKKSIKKLSLNKMTISNLDVAQLNQIYGGGMKKSAACDLTPNCSLASCTVAPCGTRICPIK